MTPDELANAAIERLAEDEALRGDLTDDGYLPLQRWAFDQVARTAQDAAQHPAPSGVMDAAADAVRETLSAAVAAAESGDLTDLISRVRPPAIAADAVPAVRMAVQQLALGAEPDANAQALAAALAVGTAGVSAETNAGALAPAAAPVSDPAGEMTDVLTDVLGTAGVPTPVAPASAEADCEEA